jgi:SWI/SNF-related matrix-associated actin-dependent regulator 1 of chromatin subfamily A
MIKLHYTAAKKTFYIRPNEMKFTDIPLVQDAGFYWFDEAALWVTTDQYRAANLFIHSSNISCSTEAFDELYYICTRVRDSKAESFNVRVPAPKGEEYLPFQVAGIDAVSRRFSGRHKAALLADPMGLGKSIMAAGVINYNLIDPTRVLVVCPASLRINWVRELDKWLIWPKMNAIPVLNGLARINNTVAGTVIVSYDLTLNPTWFKFMIEQSWDLIIFDESHYLKNPEAKRAKACLAIAEKATNVLLLSGTPIPNRAHEFYSTLNALAPDVSGGLTEQQFNNRYTTGYMDTYGWQITGGRNQEELNTRLRGTGFMVRRDKRKVLPQLPPERHSLVVFPPTPGTAAVLKKEENIQFTATEILEAGKPLGYGAIPELRREMGIEKLPDAISWIKDQMEGGLRKLVVFAYHREVLEGLQVGLADYVPVLVCGSTPMPMRQICVDDFQNKPECQIIIGGWVPLGIGWTLTAADTGVFVESSFVPGQNDQCLPGRILRIGQKAEGVNVIHLVVEGSIDATVMAAAAGKQYDIEKVLK